MSAEERWAQQQEWNQERGELEIKSYGGINSYPGVYDCEFNKCLFLAIDRRCVGEVAKEGGIEIYLCEDHSCDENAFEIYRRRCQE